MPRARRRLKRRTPDRHSANTSNAKIVARTMNGKTVSFIKVLLADPRSSRVAHLGVVSNNDDPVVVDGEESAVDNYCNTVPGDRLDGQFTFGQNRQQGRVAGQDSDFHHRWCGP